MITIKDLSWSNWFSYGESNYINFEQPVLQIMGTNGSGKTSIPIILQEVFYGKNSKGKKKSSLPNRYIKNPILKAESNFFDDAGNKYKVELIRKSSLKLKLFKNGKDISSHTTTGTYKTINEIIGKDFKTFAQLTYQSSTDNLEFLTATDSNRKKFLINLFGLNKYLGIQEQFKSVSSELNSEMTALNSKISTIEGWIKRHENMDFSLHDIQEMPEIDNDDVDKLAELKSSLINIKEINKKINENNQYKELLNSLDLSALQENLHADKEEKIKLVEEGKTLKLNRAANEAIIKSKDTLITKIKKLNDICHSCGQEIPSELKTEMMEEAVKEKDLLMEENQMLNARIDVLRQQVLHIQEIERKIAGRNKVDQEFTRLKSLVKEDLSEEVLDQGDLELKITEMSRKLNDAKASVAAISKANAAAAAHNSKINVILEQLEDHNNNLNELASDAEGISDTISKVDIIKKAFGPSGLLSYKLDYLVKDLEKEINTYLAALSNGKFQLVFKLENEKLNIEIIDEGMSVGIEEVSAGEQARINAATLLAIRKLMSAISSTKLNILFLDEIMGVLDEEGKEVLIEVLHNEEDLNTLLVSHEYSHPLIPKVTIVKESKISRIEDG